MVDTYLQFLVGPRVSPEFLVINVVFCVVISLCLSEDWLFRPKTRPFCTSSFPISPTSEHSQKTKILLLGNWTHSQTSIGKLIRKIDFLISPGRVERERERESRLKRIYILWNLHNSPLHAGDLIRRSVSDLKPACPSLTVISASVLVLVFAQPQLKPCCIPAPASHDRDHHWSDPHQQLHSLSLIQLIFTRMVSGTKL